MKWITRERPKIDRIACPWLIRRFVDPAAEFVWLADPARAPRGVLFDRHGEILVANQNTFNITLVREHVKDLDATLRALPRPWSRIGGSSLRWSRIVNHHPLGESDA